MVDAVVILFSYRSHFFGRKTAVLQKTKDVLRSPQVRFTYLTLLPPHRLGCSEQPTLWGVCFLGYQILLYNTYYYIIHIILVGRSLKASASGGELFENYLIFTLFRGFFEKCFINNDLKFCFTYYRLMKLYL